MKITSHIKYSILHLAMACCHSLSVIDGNLIGDPLDLSTFEFTKWQFNDQPNLHSGISVSTSEGDWSMDILVQYMFDPTLQRMSVIAIGADSILKVYSKGAPEVILSLCKIESVQVNIYEVLNTYAGQGARVLAIAMKSLDAAPTNSSDLRNNFFRHDVEKNLHFLGLVVFKNSVKNCSKSTINILQDANIRCIMATGDNLKTAATVARQVNIIKPTQSTIEMSIENEVLKFTLISEPEKAYPDKNGVVDLKRQAPFFSNLLYQFGLSYVLVLTGHTYRKLKALNQFKLVEKVLLSGGVFARMTPEDKVELVEDLKMLNYGVGMCGDGANDCGPLKAAHAGE